MWRSRTCTPWTRVKRSLEAAMSEHNLLEMTRARLTIKQPFWATLSMNLELVVDRSIETACTDGRVLRYNPDFLESLPPAQRETLLAHETAECASRHPWRLGNRDLELANIAGDYPINEMLEKDGFEPIPGWYRDTRFDGMAMEQIYSKLSAEQGSKPKPEDGKGKPGNQPGQGQPGGQQNGPGKGNASPAVPSKGQGEGTGAGSCPTGQFQPAPADLEDPADGEPGGMSEEDWKVAVEQAVMVARAAGSLPGAFAAQYVKAKEPKVDWIGVLREFVVRNLPSEPTWSTPNRRYIWQGIYLPGVSKENTGEGVLAVDCSGSTMPYQKIFANEFKGIITEARPERTTVIYWDAKSVIPDEDTAEYGPDDLEIEMQPRG